MNENMSRLSFDDLIKNYDTIKQNKKKIYADNDRFATLAFNTGEMYQLPWESGFAKFRRFLAVNPSIRFSDLNKSSSNKAITQDALSAVFTRLFALEPAKFSACRPLLTLSSGSQGISRNCPECSKNGFHSDFFEYEWVERCPVHNLPLVKTCVDCNKPWPVLNEYNARDCYSCTKIPPIKLSDMKIIRLQHNQAKSQFESWKQFIDQSSKQFGIVGYPQYSNTSKFRMICLSDKDALEYWQYFNVSNEQRQNKNKTEVSQINSKVFNVTSIHRKIHMSDHHHLDKYLKKRKKWSKGVRRKVANALKKFCDNHASNTHKFHRQSLFSSHINSGKKVKICPYCFSVNLWLDTTSDFALSYSDSYFFVKQPSIDDLLRKAPSYKSIALLGRDVFNNHLIIEDTKNNQEFLKWSLEYHLRGWFIEIFTSVNDALPAFEENKWPQVDSHGQFASFLQSRIYEFWHSNDHFGTIRTVSDTLEQITVTGKQSLLPSFDDLFKLASYSGLSCTHFFESSVLVEDSDEREKYYFIYDYGDRPPKSNPVQNKLSGLDEVKKFIKAKRLNRQHLEDELKQMTLEFAKKTNDPFFRKRIIGFKLP
jgi:hypothetical protein